MVHHKVNYVCCNTVSVFFVSCCALHNKWEGRRTANHLAAYVIPGIPVKVFLQCICWLYITTRIWPRTGFNFLRISFQRTFNQNILLSKQYNFLLIAIIIVLRGLHFHTSTLTWSFVLFRLLFTEKIFLGRHQ